MAVGQYSKVCVSKTRRPESIENRHRRQQARLQLRGPFYIGKFHSNRSRNKLQRTEIRTKYFGFPSQFSTTETYIDQYLGHWEESEN